MDLAGQKFGKWAVIEKGQRRGYNEYWKCLCSGCDKIHEVAQTSLRKGVSNGCRQCSGSYKTVDMNGQWFGKWEVLSQVKSTGRSQVYWWCRCHGCDTKHEVASNEMRSGRNTQCIECSKKKYFKDLTGQQFQSWKIIKYTGHRKWECVCTECNQKYTLTSDNIFRTQKCRPCTERENFKDHTGEQFGLWRVLEYVGRGSLKWRCLCTGCNRTFEILTRSLSGGWSTGCVDCSKFRIHAVQTKRFGEIWCQGYEPFALRFWDRFCPDIMNVERGPKVPGPYGYDLSPDFSITKTSGQQFVIEIKSAWTLYGTTGRTPKSTKTKLYLRNKKKYDTVRRWCKRNGSDFVLWCLDDQRSFRNGMKKLGYDTSVVSETDFWSDK